VVSKIKQFQAARMTAVGLWIQTVEATFYSLTKRRSVVNEVSNSHNLHGSPESAYVGSLAERQQSMRSISFYAFHTRLFIVPNIIDNSTRDGWTLMTQKSGLVGPFGQNCARS
jgi:hypothetical protein